MSSRRHLHLAACLWRGEGWTEPVRGTDASLHLCIGVWRAGDWRIPFDRGFMWGGKKKGGARPGCAEHPENMVSPTTSLGAIPSPVWNRQGRVVGLALTATSIRAEGVRIQSGAEPHGLGSQADHVRGAAQGYGAKLSTDESYSANNKITGAAGECSRNFEWGWGQRPAP